jgi:pullulanase
VVARQFMKAFIARWLHDFRSDGIRIDSVENLASWDFVGDFSHFAREAWRARGAAQGLPQSDSDARPGRG